MNYGELKAAVTAWSKRTDLAAQIPAFVSLAQERLSREARVRGMIASASLSTTAGNEAVALPSDWMQGLSLDIEGNGLEYRTPEELRSAYPSTYSGRPAVYTVEGSSLILGPKPDSAYTVRARYYQRPTAFGSDSATDYVLTHHSGVYLFATLVELALYAYDTERSAIWEQRYQQALRDLNAAEGSAAAGGTTLRMRAH